MVIIRVVILLLLLLKNSDHYDLSNSTPTRLQVLLDSTLCATLVIVFINEILFYSNNDIQLLLFPHHTALNCKDADWDRLNWKFLIAFKHNNNFFFSKSFVFPDDNTQNIIFTYRNQILKYKICRHFHRFSSYMECWSIIMQNIRHFLIIT